MSVHARITRGRLDPQALLARVGDPGAGAAILFLGTVRETNEGRAVSGMRYDAYDAMAEKVLREIAAEAASRVTDARGLARIAVEHRVGELGIGEPSVAIAVSSPHRAEAFDACRYIIEQIKVRLPVWKQEHYASGEVQWLTGSRPPKNSSQ